MRPTLTTTRWVAASLLFDVSGSMLAAGFLIGTWLTMASDEVYATGTARAGGGHTPSAPPPCHASALSAVVGLGALTQALAGAMYIRNPTRNKCVLRGYPRVRFYDARGRYVPTALEFGKFTFFAPQPGPARDVRLELLRPKHRAFFYLEWTNWCDGAVYYPLTLRVTVPGMVGELCARDDGSTYHVYHGARRQAIPQCQSAVRPSNLAVSSIHLIAPGHPVFKP